MADMMSYNEKRKSCPLSPVVTTDLGYTPKGLVTPPISPADSISMAFLVRPPTVGGGPLSSHPTTPIDIPGTWLCPSTSTIDLQAQVMKRSQQSKGLSTPPLSSISPTSRTSSASHSTTGAEPSRTDSYRAPLTPASANSRPRRGSTTIRKLLSLSGLRSSSLSSPTSLDTSSARSSTPSLHELYHSSQGKVVGSRPESRGIKRAASTLMPSLMQDELRPQTQGDLSHKRKSTGWFRRTSQLFTGIDFTEQSNEARPTSIGGQLPVISRPISQLPQDPRIVKNARMKRNFTAPESYSYSYEARPTTSIDVLQRPAVFEAIREKEVPRTSHGFSSKESRAAPRLPELDAINGNGGFLDIDNMLSSIGR